MKKTATMTNKEYLDKYYNDNESTLFLCNGEIASSDILELMNWSRAEGKKDGIAIGKEMRGAR